MYKLQRKNLISIICIYIGLPISIIGVCTLFLWFRIISNEELAGILTIVSFSLICIGILMYEWLNFNHYKFRNVFFKRFISVTDYGIKGVPNNKYQEFEIPIDYLPNKILFTEEKKGIFNTTINEKKYVFDMRGWILKKYYVYELLLVMLQLKYSNNNNKNLLLPLKTKYDDITINFVGNSNKNIEYKLISNNYTVIHKRYLKSIKSKLKFFNDKYKLEIYDLYDLNCNKKSIFFKCK